MNIQCFMTVAGVLLAGAAPVASGQVTPVRSSLETRSMVGLSVVDLVDVQEDFDEQAATTEMLGPLVSPVSISSPDGVYTASTTGSASFSDVVSGTFASTQTYDGDQFGDQPTAQSFGHTLTSIFEYDFTLAGEGSVRFQGEISNSGPSPIEFTARTTVLSEFMPGSGFTGSSFEQLFTDETSAGPTPFDITVPLTAASGSYRVQIRLNHNGNSGLETDSEMGSTTVNWAITEASVCLADTNGDGSVTPADFNAWIAAFNAQAPECDQNGDGLCTPADFNAWISNFNAGC